MDDLYHIRDVMCRLVEAALSNQFLSDTRRKNLERAFMDYIKSPVQKPTGVADACATAAAASMGCDVLVYASHDAAPAARATNSGSPGDPVGNCGTGNRHRSVEESSRPRRAHNPESAGANPAAPTNGAATWEPGGGVRFSPGSDNGVMRAVSERESPRRERGESSLRDVPQQDNCRAAGGPEHHILDRSQPVKDDVSDRSEPINDDRLAALEQLSAMDQELEANHGLQGNPMIKARHNNESI